MADDMEKKGQQGGQTGQGQHSGQPGQNQQQGGQPGQPQNKKPGQGNMNAEDDENSDRQRRAS